MLWKEEGEPITPEEKLKDIEECIGPCGNACISCKEMYCLGEIADAMRELIRQRDAYRRVCEYFAKYGEEESVEDLYRKYYEA